MLPLGPDDSVVDGASLEVTGTELLVRGYGTFELDGLKGFEPVKEPDGPEEGRLEAPVPKGAVPVLLLTGAVPEGNTEEVELEETIGEPLGLVYEREPEGAPLMILEEPVGPLL